MQVMTLDACPFQSAAHMADQHLMPQIRGLEKLLSSISIKLGGESLVKTTPRIDKVDPVLDWASSTFGHWSWCALNLRALYREVSVRFSKVLNEGDALNRALVRGSLKGPDALDEIWFQTHGVPRFHRSSDPIASWRRYLIDGLDAERLLVWSFRGRPDWNLTVSVPVSSQVG